MNEKKKQYLNIGNSKSLIDQKTPTESDFEKFYEWRELRSKGLKVASIAFAIILSFMALIAFIIGELIALAIVALFALIEIYIIKESKNTKKFVLEYCDYGTIVDKYQTHHKNDKDYYAIVEANGNKLKYKISRKENTLIDYNDEVVIFAIQNRDATFMVKKD